ncbi:hypothetical protein K7X08_002784 [Anisodus acutangulus]|uniref:Cytochrome c oxidase subunit 5C n=1 Tax=Anisodus acutangulus TaxID=402998 RepID=A0A9Q1RHM0_9SOLA|nr:hypothetical protein K7X08_002784 [Anisodus acutangulus]
MLACHEYRCFRVAKTHQQYVLEDVRNLQLRRKKEGGKMAGSHVAHAAYKGPSVVKEILIEIALGIAAGGLWKKHHWNNQRRTKEFYDMLGKGDISVVVDEE